MIYVWFETIRMKKLNIKIIYSAIFAVLFILGILLLTITEIFSESWLTGLIMIGISIALVIVLTIKKFR